MSYNLEQREYTLVFLKYEGLCIISFKEKRCTQTHPTERLKLFMYSYISTDSRKKKRNYLHGSVLLQMDHYGKKSKS